jgi:hypothetical protein
MGAVGRRPAGSLEAISESLGKELCDSVTSTIAIWPSHHTILADANYVLYAMSSPHIGDDSRTRLLNPAHAADRSPQFTAELPCFQAAAWDIFNPYDLTGYLASLKPSLRKKMHILYVSESSRSCRH